MIWFSDKNTSLSLPKNNWHTPNPSEKSQQSKKHTQPPPPPPFKKEFPLNPLVWG